MPRIDPLQLLKCLSVLLSPEGGILSSDEVPRLVNLMTKFSKKLVSKCVYVLILKNTETNLVDMFMTEGGWSLIQTWLQDAAQSGNWDLVREILELLLITPVDVERLKMNCLPKLIKNLSRREDLPGVAQLSDKIVQNWLVIVKGTGHNAHATEAPQPVQQSEKLEIVHEQNIPVVGVTETVAATASVDHVDGENVVEIDNIQEEQVNDNSDAISAGMFYKLSRKDGKQVNKKLPPSEESSNKDSSSTPSEKSDEEKETKKDDDKKSSGDLKKSRSSSSSSSRSKHSSKDRYKDRKKSSSSSSSSRSKSKSSSRDKDRKDKDKHRSSDSKSSPHSSSKSSSSKDKKDSKDKSKEKQAEKDKDTLAKIKPQNIDKLGRIPKKSSIGIDEKSQPKDNKDEKSQPKDKEDKSKENREAKKKPAFSILDRKSTGEERTKTVKVYNSKLRSTGLEEEVKPPPPRGGKKPTPSVQLPTIPQKRPSPPRDLPSSVPPEKKLKIDKIDIPERPGAIKLIPPKPKPAVIQESDLFMDALTASATTKKEPKKRKRRASVSKDTPPSPTSPGAETKNATSPPQNNNTPTLGLKNIAPINFYQDTLSSETESTENIEKENEENIEQNNTDVKSEGSSSETPASPVQGSENNDLEDVNPPKVAKLDGGLKGVLLHMKKKGPKRSIQWKAEEDLVEIRYFELDETERVNVTKTFDDMAKMELSSERKAIELSRKLPNEDVMEPQTKWRMLYMCDQPESLAPPGSKSLEKDIQFAREKSVLQAIYFDKRRIPDSPDEPIPENHQMSDPIIIPLEDPDSQEVDLRNTPWPDPKGSPPHIEPQQMPPMFPNMPPFNPNFNNINAMSIPPPQFQGMPPRFVGPGPPGPAFCPPNIMQNGNMMVPPNMMGPPQEMMNQTPMNPNMFGPIPGPEVFMGPVGDNPNFPMPPFNGPGSNMNMFPPNNFPHRGRGGFNKRGGGSNSGGWVRLNPNNNSGNWKRGGNRGGGGGNRGARFCKNIQNHGHCRNGDNCPFIHPS